VHAGRDAIQAPGRVACVDIETCSLEFQKERSTKPHGQKKEHGNEQAIHCDASARYYVYNGAFGGSPIHFVGIPANSQAAQGLYAAGSTLAAKSFRNIFDCYKELRCCPVAQWRLWRSRAWLPASVPATACGGTLPTGL